jgi:transcriptional regulator with AAA-type ATPase domain
MDMPVFEHTISLLHSVIGNEQEPLQKVAHLMKYDPGLYLSFMNKVNSLTMRAEMTSISQAIALIGAEGAENHILEQSNFLGHEQMLLWSYCIIAGEAATAINRRAAIAEQDEAFFAGILPSIGMLLMLAKYPPHAKIHNLLLKVPLEHKVFIEEKLFNSNLITQLDENIQNPKIYKDTITLMLTMFSKDGQRKNYLENPSRFSVAYKSFQILQLLDVAESAARAILFPAVVEAQEKLKESAKRFFKISETVIDDILAEVIENFQDICEEFKVEDQCMKFIENAENYHLSMASFQTHSESFNKSLDRIYEANKEDKNILLYGESAVGKRLFALSLHNHPDNPRKNSPFVSIHCSSIDTDTIEMELFGAKGGYLGIEKQKGALELANGGTILLKDIDKVPLTMQDKLSEVFCKDEYYKIGEIKLAYFNVKFILTSKKDIAAEAQEGRFSQKLLRVLKPASLYIPALRERRQDIEFIADGIIAKYELNLKDNALMMGLKEYYENHPFPNNLKDLKRLLFFLSAKHSLKP